MKEFIQLLIVIIGSLGIALLALFIFPVLLWIAWNSTLPILFHFPTISLLQAFWLDILIIIARGIQWNTKVKNG